MNESVRSNQRRRTRKDLLAAAARLLRAGKPPDMDQVAREAMVSRATAYRYFPSIEALLIEAPLDGAIPDPQQVFAEDGSSDPVERVVRAETLLHEMVYRNIPQLRAMLAASLERQASAAAESEVPIRQNRRGPLIAAALAPVRDQLADETYDTLTAALSLVFGTESMVVFTDVLGLDEPTARRVKSWAIRVLVEAALRERERAPSTR